MTGVQTCAFRSYVRALTEFCNEDLGEFYFDVRKDCLYCDAATDPKRLAYRTVLDTLFHALVRYAAPVLVFTAEEVWGTRYPELRSVHLLEWPDVSFEWVNADIETTWAERREVRRANNFAVEQLRKQKLVGSGNSANTSITVAGTKFEFAEISEVFLVAPEPTLEDEAKFIWVPVQGPFTTLAAPQISVTARPTAFHKCGRCWRHLPEVASDGALCSRCDQVVAGKDPGA